MRVKNILYVAIAIALVSCRDNQEKKTFTTNDNGRNDLWGYVGYGGGGAMFYPAISPHDDNYAFVACDMTGSYVTYNGGESWRMFNLRGPVDYFVFDPHNENTVYANSIGLFKSTDRGKTWSIFYPDASLVAGVVSKGDHAQEVLVLNDSTRRRVHAFAIDPGQPNTLYAAVSVDGKNSFIVSVDGGKTWSTERELKEPAMDIFVVPSSPADKRTIYVTGKSGVEARAGDSWNTNPAPDGVKQLTKFAGGFDRETNRFVLYAISGKSYFNPAGDVSGIFSSVDGGATWVNLQDGLLSFSDGSSLPEWRSIATSALHPAVVYVSYNDLPLGDKTSCLGVAKSEDFGVTWNLTWKDQLSPQGHVVAANYESGWINDRFGPTWGENPFSLGVSPNNPEVCYGTDFGRTTKTTDGGKTWQQVYTKKDNSGNGWISRGLEVTTSYAVVFDPFDANHVFIANTDVGLMESVDGARSWRSATHDNGIPRSWMNSTYWLTFDPKVKGRAWAAMSGTHDLPRPKMFRRNGTAGYKGGIVMTDDGGRTWTPTSADIGEAAMTHILIDESSPESNRTLYACAFGKGVYKSEDGGKTWKQKNNGIKGNEPFAWRIVQRAGDKALFLIICRRSEDGSIGNDGDGAIYRSDDGAESWRQVPLPQGTNGPMSIVIDDSNERRLLLSAWGRRTNGKFSADIGGGIFVSNDEGNTWTPTLSSDQHIHDLTFDPRTQAYYACGFNGSAYRSEDRGQTWSRLRGYNFKWGKRVDLDPRDSSKIFIITFGGGVWYGPASGDANAAEDIVPAIPLAHPAR